MQLIIRLIKRILSDNKKSHGAYLQKFTSPDKRKKIIIIRIYNYKLSFPFNCTIKKRTVTSVLFRTQNTKTK